MNKEKNQIFKLSAIALSVSLVTACSDNDSSTSGPSFPGAGSEAAAYTINTTGATGNSLGGGLGGTGGGITITLNEGMEGRLEILDNGKVDTSFMAHSMTGDTGSTGATIAANTTIAVVGAEPAANTLYMVANDSRLYKSDGDGTIAELAEVVSGLTIDAAATLTIDLNTAGSSAASLAFTDDLVNNGIITTADDTGGAKKGDLSLMAKNIITSNTSSITTAGTSQTIVDGGSVSLNADYMIMNAGTITASGFTDTATTTPVSGGNAGSIQLSSVTRLYNTANLSAAGGIAGNATGNNGGNGGSIILTSDMGDLNNSGALNSRGGNADVVPGNAGAIALQVNNYGTLMNGGNLTANGGVSQLDNGGTGGNISLGALGGDVKNSGDITSTGGSAAESMVGGNGGSLNISSSWGDFESLPGNILVSGNIDLAGGTVANGTVGGGTGGNGGAILIDANSTSYNAAPQLVGLWGYSSATLNGGNGENGGAAGSFIANTFTTKKTIDVGGSSLEWRSSGNIVNEIDITAKGGDSTSTTVTSRRGGTGGSVNLLAQNTTNTIGDSQKVSNTGDIITSAGINHERAGGVRTSGAVKFDATGGVTNSGAVTTTGGNDNDTTGVGRGNHAGSVLFTSAAGSVSNSSVIAAVGGDGQDIGGNGANVSLMGVTVSNTANLSTNGGNATATVGGSIGGNAGNISMVAKTTGSASDSGTHTQTGGTGETAGSAGVKYTYSGH